MTSLQCLLQQYACLVLGKDAQTTTINVRQLGPFRVAGRCQYQLPGNASATLLEEPTVEKRYRSAAGMTPTVGDEVFNAQNTVLLSSENQLWKYIFNDYNKTINRIHSV